MCASSNGYAIAELTPARMEARFQAVADATDPASPKATLARFVIENGKAGAVLA